MIVSKITKNALLFLLGSGLMGCQMMTKNPIQPVAAEPDVVSTRLAFAAEKAAAALDTISGIEQQRAPQMPPVDNYSNAPSALLELITVKWSGPAEQMLETLASRAGMKFKVKGNKSGVPLLVNINVYQKPVIDVLRDLGLQAGRRADITVNGQNNYIEIRYAPVDRT